MSCIWKVVSTVSIGIHSIFGGIRSVCARLYALVTRVDKAAQALEQVALYNAPQSTPSPMAEAERARYTALPASLDLSRVQSFSDPVGELSQNSSLSGSEHPVQILAAVVGEVFEIAYPAVQNATTALSSGIDQWAVWLCG